jgi:nicotinamidase-related amidase
MRDQTALQPGRCHLVVIDIQTRLAAAMPSDRRAGVLAAVRLLGTATRLFGVPVTLTEHVPGAIGATEPDVVAAFENAAIVPKVHFGAANEPAVVERLTQVGRDTILLAGMEAHVCVLQTGLGLVERGQRVVLLADAVCSRDPKEEALALERARFHGIEVASTEMVAFEWLHRADHPARRSVIEAVKARG